MRVLFLGLPENAIQELLDNGVDLEYAKRLTCHEGEICEAYLSRDYETGNWEDNDYDLYFSDGFVFNECSGFHLEEVK